MAQGRRPQPPMALGASGIHLFQRSEYVLHGVAEAFGSAAADLDLTLDVVQGQAAPAPLKPDRQPHDVRRPVVTHSPSPSFRFAARGPYYRRFARRSLNSCAMASGDGASPSEAVHSLASTAM